MTTTIFDQVLAECEAMRVSLQAHDFVTDHNLQLKISRRHLPEELRGAPCRDLELFVVQQDATACLQEIGRLREEAFRRAGGGTQREIDLDDWDHSGFWQLLCLDLRKKEICGAYRLLYGAQLYADGTASLGSAQGSAPDAWRDGAVVKGMGSVHGLFDFSPAMLQHVLPQSIELGRSFVNENAERAQLALPLLFEALGQILCRNAAFALGKVTFYPRGLTAPILWLVHTFLDFYWGEQKNPLLGVAGCTSSLASPLAKPRRGLDFCETPVICDSGYSMAELQELSARLCSQLPEHFENKALQQLLYFFDHLDQDRLDGGATPVVPGGIDKDERKQSRQTKSTVLRALALFLKYVSQLHNDGSASGMHTFGGAINPHFGDVIEFMILVEVAKFHPENLKRWQATPKFLPGNAQMFENFIT